MSATTPPPMARRAAAELLGTFWLVLAGCGTAVLAATAVTDGADGSSLFVGVGYVGVALAFGLAVTTAAYGLGHVSGGHFNPAVSVGLAVAGRLPWRDVPAYVAAQLVGATAGAGVLYAVASGRAGFDAADGFATNGFGDRSPQGYGLLAGLVAELVLTSVFVLVILGATSDAAPKGLAPLAIGLTLTVIHLVSIPVTNTSVNPARSFAPALFAGGEALGQLWLFVLAPLAGAVVGGLVWSLVRDPR